MNLYCTIVADPPWRVAAGPRSLHDPRELTRPLAYATMSPDEIKAVPVADLAADDAHLYLWTINAYVEQAYGIARAWGFVPSTLLVWAKSPKGRGLGGAFATASSLPALSRLDRVRHLR
jgi:N6-adenosine-specific RNA methylase IME4